MEHSNLNLGQLLQFSILALLLSMLAACGSESYDDFVLDTEVARVEITPQNLVLTKIGEKRQLYAQAYNAANEPIDAIVEWMSSNPVNIDVDTSGLLTAFNLGSAVISARAGGVESPPAMMIVATPAAGAVLVSDWQVVEAPAAVDAAGRVQVGAEYTVTLSGIASPMVGDIVVGIETMPLGGRVVDVETVGTSVRLTLALVPINELFEDLVINETIDLTKAEAVIPEAIQEYYTAQKQGDGRYLFTARSTTPVTLDNPVLAQRVLAMRAIGTAANPYYPFECDFDNSVGINLDLLSPSIALEQDLSLPVIYDTSGDLQKLALSGRVKGTFSIKNTLTAAFDSKVGCKLQLLEINFPMPGPLALILGGQIPVGIGFELGGKVTAADTSLTLEASAQLIQEFGVIKQNNAWSLTGTLQPSGEAKTTVDLLPANLTEDLKFEPSLGGFGYANLTFGNPLWSAARINLAEVQGGATHAANLALIETQIGDENYASDYKLTLDFSAKPGSDLAYVMELLGVSPLALTATELSFSEILTTSPAATTLQASRNSFSMGDRVDFTVKLDPTTINYLPGIYNVEEVRIYRKLFPDGDPQGELIASQSAIGGETEFNFSWFADQDGVLADQFYAFVTTTLLPLPLLEDLELGKFSLSAGGNSILYLSIRDNGAQLYSVDPQDFTPSNLSQTAMGGLPVWSPDRTKIAYVSEIDFNKDIYVMNADGSNQVQLTQNDATDYIPTWSPDGSKIAFVSVRDGDTSADIYVMNADGTNQVNLTQDDATDYVPAWSPDGSKIAFTRVLRDRDFEIFVMNADGSNQVQLTQNSVNDTFPAWSPDGTKIAFMQEGNIAVMNADGTGQAQLTQAVNNVPSWSPDGTKIVFTSFRDGNGEIYVMNADGSNQVNLSQHSAAEGNPDWSPDGTKIAFTSDRDGNANIYVMNADGTNQTRVTTFDGTDYFPVWSSP